MSNAVSAEPTAMFYIWYLLEFIFFSTGPYISEPANGRLVSIFVNSRGYGVILVFRDWIRRLVPLFSGRWKNCRKFRRKNVTECDI